MATPAGGARGLAVMWAGYPSGRLLLMNGHGQTVLSVAGWAHGRDHFRDPPGGQGGSGNSDLMPYFSSSRTRLYYLIGEAEIDAVGPDFPSHTVKTLPVGNLQHAAFAVSPDDQTIAVAIIDYAVTPHHLRVYTENLADAGNHRELLTSSQRFEWPVAFVGADLVMAVGPTGAQTGCGDPYCALYGYRLLKADGTYIRSLCAPAADASPGAYGTSVGPINPDGAVCGIGNQFVEESWAGGQLALPDVCPGSPRLYSPDRKLILCGGPGDRHDIVDAGGHQRGVISAPPNVGTSSRYTWTDNDHLLIGGKLLEVSTGSVADVGNLSFEWRVPGDAY